MKQKCMKCGCRMFVIETELEDIKVMCHKCKTVMFGFKKKQ